jgi:S-layer protein (TIGR01567 family)
MDYVRIGGVCLLLMVIAAALPVNVLAQTPQTSANGAAPIISQSLLSESKAQGETISAETLAKRNSGLKPLGTKSSSKASGVQTSGQSQTPISTSPAAASTVTATPSTVSSATTGSSTATQTQSSSQAATVPAETSSATTAAASVTPVQTAAETGASQSSPGSATGSQNVATMSTTVTPPDNVSPGTVVSNNVTASNAQTSGNVSPNEFSSSPENASENATETQSNEATPEETEAGTDRIWREGVNPRGSYTWTPQSFSGFFYDLKNDVGTERLTIDLPSSGRSIDSNGLTYSTKAQDTDFQFGDWGSYQVIGFMAEKYFAGYNEGVVSSTNRSLINDGQLRKVLVDSDNESTLTTGSALPLEEGYELRIKQIDINGNKVFLSLAKDGEEVDSKVVSPDSSDPKSSTYKYEVDVTGEKTPIVLAHISNVFASTESDLVTVNGLFQISDSYNSVESGDKYGKMKITDLNDGVTMENEDSFSLRRDSTINIFGNVGFQVADSDALRFAPIVQRTGIYDVRGTVIDPSTTKEFTWTPYNFEGFYYDIDNDVGTESLKATISGNRIDEKDLTYTTSPQPVKFKFTDWGKYDVIGFMADKYFAGYNNQTAFTDEASVINEGQLRKVLLDSDDSQTIASGSVLPLQEGYELRIKQVDLNGNKVYLALAKDGKEIDSKVVTPSGDSKDRASNYMYKVDMGSEKDVPMITAHVQSVFTSTESNLATVDAVFQVSDSPESVEEGEVHGKMKVETLGTDGITMKNTDSTISLSRGRVVDIMENLRIEVADNAKRLTAPIATKTGEGSTIALTVPVAVVNRPVALSTKSGSQSLTGVQISVNGSSIGTTDITGSISYTPDSTGTFSVIARKSGYLDGTASMTVTTASEASTLAAIQEANKTLSYRLTLNAPAEVVKGENFLITVVEGINQTPVDKALISLDEENIGDTSAEGTLTYSANATGEHTLKAEKEGFNSTTRKITVTSSLKVVNLTVPDIGYVSQSMKISAIVQNVGNVNDSRMLELKVNDTVADSKNVTVDAGKNITVNFSYKPMDPGLCRFSLDDITRTVNVEKAQNSNWLIALILVLLIAGGAGYYLHTTGELDKLQKQVKKMMQGR